MKKSLPDYQSEPIKFILFIKKILINLIYNIAEPWIRQRYVVGMLGFFALAVGYIQRFCLSLAITEMVATHKLHPSKIDLDACPFDDSTVVTVNGTVHVSVIKRI